jgi:hypothetical protein
MVKEEPDDKNIEVYEDRGWNDTTAEEDNMQTEQTEIDLLPPDDEVKSEGCTTMEPPVIRYVEDYYLSLINLICSDLLCMQKLKGKSLVR